MRTARPGWLLPLTHVLFPAVAVGVTTVLLNRGTADAAIAAAIVGLTGGVLALGGVGAAYLWYDSRGRERFGIVIPLVMIVLTMLQGALALALRLGWSESRVAC